MILQSSFARTIRRLPAVLVFFLSLPCFAAERIVLVAGGGEKGPPALAKEVQLNAPFGIDFGKDGDAFLVELTGGRFLRLAPDGILSRIGGTDEKGSEGDGGPAERATFNGMHSLAIGPEGAVY